MTKQIIMIAALFAAACQQRDSETQPGNIVVSDIPEDRNPTPPVDAPPVAPPPPNAAMPPVAPVPAPPDSEKTVAAARKVIDAYFAALATKRYADAYRMWGGNGQATGMSLADFTASFAKYKIYDGTAYKPGDIEGAAGSAYIEFPVTVTGLLAKGGGFHLSGPVTLRRVNDVDGSTAEQRRWHIASSGLKPRP